MYIKKASNGLVEDIVLVVFHSTENQSLNQQTGPGGVQTLTEGRRWYVSVSGSVKASLDATKNNKVSRVNWTRIYNCLSKRWRWGEVSVQDGEEKRSAMAS